MLEALNSGIELPEEVKAAIQLHLAIGNQAPLPDDQIIPQQTSVVNMLRSKPKPAATARPPQQQQPPTKTMGQAGRISAPLSAQHSSGKMVTCFNCRQVGHVVSECPTRTSSSKTVSSIGRREHDADLGIGLFRLPGNKVCARRWWGCGCRWVGMGV